MFSLVRVARWQSGRIRCTLPYYVFITPANPSKVQDQRHQRGPDRVAFCSNLAPSNGVSVQYKHGCPVLVLPLPSRRESCLFYLRPMLLNVGDFLHQVQMEDPGITSTAVLTTDGERVSNATPMDALLSRDFQLQINNVTYNVHSPVRVMASSERLDGLEDMKTMVHMVHTALHLPRHHTLKERELLQRLDLLKQELTPLEKVRTQIARRAELSSSGVIWGGLALLSVQGGALAWLTWWVYSWDIMEPITYFITYSTSMGVLAYYVLTKQDYVYPDAKDRQFLHYFHKRAKKKRFNVQKYNQLRDDVALVEDDLRRLRSPIQLKLPVEQIQPKE